MEIKKKGLGEENQLSVTGFLACTFSGSSISALNTQRSGGTDMDVRRAFHACVSWVFLPSEARTPQFVLSKLTLYFSGSKPF